MFLTLFGMGKYQGTILWSFIIFKHQQLTFTSCLLCLCSILSLFLLYKWGNGSSVKLGNPDQAHRASPRGNWNSATAAWLQVCHAKPFLSHTGALREQFLSCESSLLGVLDKVRCVASNGTELSRRKGNEHEVRGMMASQKRLGTEIEGSCYWLLNTVSNVTFLVKALQIAQKLWELSEGEVEMLTDFGLFHTAFVMKFLSFCS